MAIQTATEPSVPLPTELIFCTSCRANVVPDSHGRCSCGLLGIYPEGQRRPEIVTERLLMLRDVAADADRFRTPGRVRPGRESQAMKAREPRGRAR